LLQRINNVKFRLNFAIE